MDKEKDFVAELDKAFADMGIDLMAIFGEEN